MKEALEELLNKETLSVQNILRYIDDYSIYSHYIGKELELGKAYSSPFREDLNPSFSLFLAKNNKIYFKDYGSIYKGDVFEFVKILLQLNSGKTIGFDVVLKQIDRDFELGLYENTISTNKVLKKRKLFTYKAREKVTIKITSRHTPTQEYINFWNKYDITQPILDFYNVTNILLIHYLKKKKNSFYMPKTLSIAYRIGLDYELYFPYEYKKNKFRNSLPSNWVKGYTQLKYINNFCIITKAFKEIIFFREHFDWDTVAGKSETTHIPKHIMNKLFQNYKYVFIWLDPDEAGQQSQEKYIKNYPNLILLKYSNEITQKDPTDRYEYMKLNNRKKEAINEIKKLIYDKI